MPNLVGQDQYTNQVRQMESTDLAVPDTWNPIHKILIDNDVHLQTNKASKTTAITGTDGLTGGGDLSANRTISIADNGVTDAKIGNRTVSDATAPTGDTSTLGTILNWLANMIKAVTGAANWRTAPAITLAATKTHVDATAAGTHGSTSAATANTLMHRDATGRAKVAAPSAVDDIARKDTVDAVQTNLTTHTGVTAAGTHGSTSAATANTLMHRDAAGRAKVAAPSAVDDIARKDTVDAVQTNLTTHTGATAAGTHGSTSAATANTLMHRDAAGRAKVAAPSAADDIARKDTVDAAQDNATEASLVIEAVMPVENAEPTQIQTSKGPAVQFANGVTQSVTWCRRFPFGSNACKAELVIAADAANAGGFRVRVAWQVNGGVATNVDVTVTPGSNTNLYTADLGIIVPDASVTAGDLVTFTLSRLGADAADTHTGNLLVYHSRLVRG